MEEQPKTSRKVKQGKIISNKMDKTVIVGVERTIQHPRYGKIIKHSKKYYAHNENQDLQVGDTVQIIETRPLSKTKRWRVVAKQT